MSTKKAALPALRGTASAPLLYWLLLVCGLAAFTVLRIDELGKAAPLWVGTVLGAAFGQLLSWRRIRLWLAAFFVLNAMWVLPLMVLPFLARGSDAPWEEVQTALMAFAPAAICGYFSLSERSGLLAFWFPASLWMLTILDRSPKLSSREGWVMLGALAVLLVAFLRARETRRAAIWTRHAAVRLAAPAGPAVVLRRSPLRAAAQLAWVLSLGAASLALTAWIAPHLWQTEKLPGHHAATSAAGQGYAGQPYAWAGDATCCPDEATVVDVHRRRVKEYLPLLRAHDEAAPPSLPSRCTVCRDGVPIRVAAGRGTVAAGVGYGPYSGGPGWNGGAASPSVAQPPPAPTTHVVAEAPSALPSAAPVASTLPKAPVPTVAQRPRPSPVARPAAAYVPPRPAYAWQPPRSPAVQAEAGETHPVAWLLTLVVVGLALQAAMRPLRRLLTVRHLGRPLWPEALDQRVSNLWQLALVGLRDAGWHAIPGEQPRDLARRVGLEGMETCATVLDRVRHGVRVDAEDLEAMTRAAHDVYRAARRGAGWGARVSAWLRWPLA